MAIFFLFSLFIQGVLSAQFPAVSPAKCVTGTEFYSPSHPRFLLYCIQPGVYNVTGCLDSAFSKVSFNSHVDLAEETHKHLGFRFKCVVLQEQKQKIVKLQYTGCVDMKTKVLTIPGKTFVDPATKQTCVCNPSGYFSCG